MEHHGWRVQRKGQGKVARAWRGRLHPDLQYRFTVLTSSIMVIFNSSTSLSLQETMLVVDTNRGEEVGVQGIFLQMKIQATCCLSQKVEARRLTFMCR